MKSATTVLALASLYSADSFVVQTPTHVMQPLHAESYVNGLAPPAVGTAAPAPFAPPRYDSPTITEKYDSPKTTKQVFEKITPVKVQGGTLKTCSFDEEVERVSVYLKTEGRPLNADVELWQGPDNSPQQMTVYLEDGSLRPFRCVVESPGSSNSVSIRNTAEMEFPLFAGLDVELDKSSASPTALLKQDKASFRIVQGGAVYTTPFSSTVSSVQVVLETDGRPLNARIELLQGPNNTKQIMEVYTEDGAARPFVVVIDTPGSGNVVRIVNTNTIEYPLSACVDAYLTDDAAAGAAAPGGMQWT